MYDSTFILYVISDLTESEKFRHLYNILFDAKYNAIALFFWQSNWDFSVLKIGKKYFMVLCISTEKLEK